MLGSKQTPPNRERLAIHLFGHREISSLVHEVGQIVQAARDLFVLPPEERAPHLQALAVEDLRTGGVAAIVDHCRQMPDGLRGQGLVRARGSLLDRQCFTVVPFRLSVGTTLLMQAADAVEASSKIQVVFTSLPAADLEALEQLRFRLGVSSKPRTAESLQLTDTRDFKEISVEKRVSGIHEARSVG